MHKKGGLSQGEQQVYETHASAGAKLAQQIGTLDDSTIQIIQDALKPKDYPERIYEYLGMTERMGYFYSKGDV